MIAQFAEIIINELKAEIPEIVGNIIYNCQPDSYRPEILPQIVFYPGKYELKPDMKIKINLEFGQSLFLDVYEKNINNAEKRLSLIAGFILAKRDYLINSCGSNNTYETEAKNFI